MDLGEARKKWSLLHAQWAEAHVEAIDARGVCTAKFRAAIGPSDDELNRAEVLEARAGELRDAMDEFIGQYFGD
ncbi:MAG: hypothetical protein V4739_11720 [Pseudomonadota bacterium]